MRLINFEPIFVPIDMHLITLTIRTVLKLDYLMIYNLVGESIDVAMWIYLFPVEKLYLLAVGCVAHSFCYLCTSN